MKHPLGKIPVPRYQVEKDQILATRFAPFVSYSVVGTDYSIKKIGSEYHLYKGVNRVVRNKDLNKIANYVK